MVERYTETQPYHPIRSRVWGGFFFINHQYLYITPAVFNLVNTIIIFFVGHFDMKLGNRIH